jgi:hypothetical protein
MSQQNDRFSQLKEITTRVRAAVRTAPDLIGPDGAPMKVDAPSSDLNEDLEILSAMTEITNADDDVTDMIPAVWMQWLERRFITPLWNPKFWESVASKECFMYTKYQRRFFPMRGDQDWEKLSRESYKSNYPEFEKHAKHSNFAKGNNLKLHTNFGMIPQWDPRRFEVETQVVVKVINLSIALRNHALKCKLWYTLATNYDMCHIVLKNPVGRQLTRSLWTGTGPGSRTERDLVQAGLFWTNYVLAHEEQTCQAPSEGSRFVFTLEEINHLSFLNNLPPDVSPWIVNSMRNGNNVYNLCPFYLQGERSVSTPAVAQERISRLTHGCFRGFDRWNHIAALTGSTLMQSLSNNPLMRPPVKDNDDGAINLVPDARSYTDMVSFEHRSRLYFPREGDMSSDLDVVVSTASNKEFIIIADAMVKQLDENLNAGADGVAFPKDKFRACAVVHDCTASGVRYHVSHPRLGIKIEIFRSPQRRMKLVAGFHVAPVRMYWDFGKRWYMTRNCAASLITGISENFHWFSSNKVPVDVILKYCQRGVTTILNLKELECLSKYMETSERWGYGFSKITEITGAFRRDHPFFRVDIMPRGVRYGLPVLSRARADNWRHNTYKLARALKSHDIDWKERYQEIDNTFRVRVPPPLAIAA